jgi:hypothetical protein
MTALKACQLQRLCDDVQRKRMLTSNIQDAAATPNAGTRSGELAIDLS